MKTKFSSEFFQAKLKINYNLLFGNPLDGKSKHCATEIGKQANNKAPCHVTPSVQDLNNL